jgi:5-(carboxyamino)imidazole ribonucleotide synthase
LSRVILPGATLGVLGSGQLGRMFAIAARRLGYRVHVFSPDYDTPTGQVADLEVRAAYDDLDAVAEFARRVSVVTFEFENVPAATTAACEQHAPVRPGGHVLHTTQNRLREKAFLKNAGIPVTPFWPVGSQEDLAAALAECDGNGVLKTAAWGYDGKGQARIRGREEAADVGQVFNLPKVEEGRLEICPTVLESFIDFACEVSVIGARGIDGSFVAYGPVQNVHANHILDVTSAPASIGERVAKDAVEITRTIFERLEIVGVLCVEFFVSRDDQLLVNELAPRPHNSGHYTIDACVSCQFEQQVRAACGLPLGSPEQLRPAAMANLLGDLWQDIPPNWAAALAHRDVKLHLYGKAEPRTGRKMGHLTALADTADQAAERVLAARAALTSA